MSPLITTTTTVLLALMRVSLQYLRNRVRQKLISFVESLMAENTDNEPLASLALPWHRQALGRRHCSDRLVHKETVFFSHSLVHSK